jgi:hypothetical protein
VSNLRNYGKRKDTIRAISFGIPDYKTRFHIINDLKNDECNNQNIVNLDLDYYKMGCSSNRD